MNVKFLDASSISATLAGSEAIKLQMFDVSVTSRRALLLDCDCDEADEGANF